MVVVGDVVYLDTQEGQGEGVVSGEVVVLLERMSADVRGLMQRDQGEE